ncbi:MAG: type III pantothenate kinase [Ignavibacteria bacterium]
MNLTIDIGNSFIHFAVYSGSILIFASKASARNNEDLRKSFELLSRKYKIYNIGISSVSKANDNCVFGLAKILFRIEPLTVSPKSRLPISIKIKNPQTLGADRICNAVFGHNFFKGKFNVLVADLGTANTFDVVNKKGEFIGGIIAPGIMTSSKALSVNTSNLPLLEYKKLSKNAPLIGKNTFEAIQSGLVNYMISASEGIIEKVRKQLGGNLKVMLTGGSAELLLKKVNFPYVYSENTVLEGINIILNYQNSLK